MNVRLISCLLLMVMSWATFWPATAGADPITDLYAARVTVTNQSAQTRAAALRDALAQVLVKATGHAVALQTAEAAALLENPDRWLQQFRYETISPPPLDPAAPRLALRVEFDGVALERRLRDGGLPLWGRERPLTLIWLALSDGIERQLLAADAVEPVVETLRRAAERRGLPIELPIMDREDATRVNFTDVWGVFEEPLLAAAARYTPDAMLAGSVFRADDTLWAGRWTLLRDDSRQRWEVSGATPEAVVAAVIDALAEHYADEFAVYAPLVGEGTVVIEITGVAGLDDYAAMQGYLAGLSIVKDVHLLAVDGELLRFELDLGGTSRSLEQAIALGRVLEPVGGGEVVVPLGAIAGVDFTAGRTLRYRYRR